MWGYAELIDILSDPTHQEHQERLDWLGLDTADGFNPTHFDLTDTNNALTNYAKSLIKG